MKTISALIIASVLLLGCAKEPKAEANTLEERLSRIENGLEPDLQIEGDTIPNYNIEERLKELNIPGVSIAVLNSGEIEWAKGYGMASIEENRKVTPETKFLAGSISKPVSALLAHKLVEEGKLDLDTNINEYLVSWKLPDNEFTETEKVTTRRILNHTAGLTVWGFPGYDKGDTIPSVQEVLDGKGNTDAVRVYKEPGESWMYSGGGYTILQLMMTEITGRDFPELMRTEVLNPLGMTDSTFENPLPEQYHAIAATGYRGNGEEVEGQWPIYPEMAAAGLWTTPSELILWAKEIQNIDQNNVDGLLKKETVKEMLVQGMGDFGLGPQVSEYTYGHGGADEGFRANMVVWKDSPVAVVMMVNSDNGSIMQEILLSITKEYDLPGIEPQVRKVNEVSEEKRQAAMGTYSIPRMGEVEIKLKDKGLMALASFSEDPLYLLPESDSIYFNKDNGQYFKLKLNDGNVVGFEYGGVEGMKIDTVE